MEVRNGDQESHDYHFKIAGQMDESWSDWLDCSTITYEHSEKDQIPVTIITCALSDQSALRGLLNRLFDLNLTILSVNIRDSSVPGQEKNFEDLANETSTQALEGGRT
jgi:hypothetical protein